MRPAARAAWGEIQPAPEIRSTRVDGDSRRIASLSSAPGRLAEEQVHERHVRLVAAGQVERLLHVRGRQAALHPRLLGEQQPEAPVHHVVVVHHQHAQVALGAQLPSSFTCATRRTRQCPGGSGPNSTTPPD